MNVLITGGSSGLGESITRKLAGEIPGKVYFTYNQSEATARAIETEFERATAIRCNFKSEASVNELVGLIPQLDISVLINNAYTGTFIDAYFHKTAVADFDLAFRENLLPTIAVSQAAIGVFRKKKSGKIITILTAALVNTPPIGSSVYVANKAYLRELTKIWAVENAKYNITSNSISPSFMLTNFTSSVDERLVEQMEQDHPLLKTDEVAESVLFLVNASAQINGINLIINSADNII
jgi:3-oxoacyl-[acyl-carrier protein] reductase